MAKKSVPPLVGHLAPDTVPRLERAAGGRYDDGVVCVREKRPLCAVYLFGHSVEMCLTAAYFRAAGFGANTPIDRDTRMRRMKFARNELWHDGEPLMSSDPHPLVGWARLLAWQRSLSKQSAKDRRLLDDVIANAQAVYKHWRPELRYKITDVKADQLGEVLKASTWFVEQRGRL